jgi:hypothetical protein
MMQVWQIAERVETAPTAPTPNVARFVSKASCYYATAASGSTGDRLRTAVYAGETGL